jgi:hypothetical protein
MRNILLAIILAVLPASAALSEGPKPDKSAGTGRLLPVRPASRDNACAAYGAGFAKVEGTDTCVKVGGAVSIGVGSSSPVGSR